MHWQTISPESIRWKWIEDVTANHPNAKTISSAHETNWDLSNSKHKDSAIRIIRNKHTLFNFGRASIASPPCPFPYALPIEKQFTCRRRKEYYEWLPSLVSVFSMWPPPYLAPTSPPTHYRIRTCMIYAIMISDSFLFHFKQRKTLTSLIVLKQIQRMMRWEATEGMSLEENGVCNGIFAMPSRVGQIAVGWLRNKP